MGTANYRQGTPTMLDYTPGGAVSAGDIVVVGDTVRVSHHDIAASKLGALAAYGGVYDCPKATSGGSAMSDGKVAFWDTVALVITTTPNGNTKVFGVTAGASADADTTQRVLHMPQKSLTDSGGGTSGSAIAAGAAVVTFPIFVNLADLANAETLSFDPGFNGKITAVNFRVGAKPVTTAAKAATLTAEVNGTNVTGGAVALTSANCTPAGAQVAGSAITAANTFTSGQTIGVNVSGVTTFAEGNGVIELTVLNTDLANALSSLNAF